MLRNVNQMRQMKWNRVIAVVGIGVVGWLANGAKADINVTGPGNRIPIVVVPKKGSNIVPPFGRNRSRPFHSNGTFQTLDAEQDSGASPGNIIHPDPDDPSDMVFLSLSSTNLTVEAGESAELTVTVTRLGAPRASYVFMMGIPEGLGINYEGFGGPMGTATSRTFTITTTTTVPPEAYQFYILGLTNENKWTEPADFILNVEAPPTPPPTTTTNSGQVTVVNSDQSVILQGTYELDGALQQVGAMYDNENDHIVNAMPVGNNTTPFPRFTRFVGLGTWTIDVGRGYAGNGFLTANVVVTATVSTNHFVAAHLHVGNTGVVTPILLTAGDLNNPAGTVESTDAFQVAIEGALPTASNPGFIRGVVEGTVIFLEPDGATLWADGITFTFDLPLFID